MCNMFVNKMKLLSCLLATLSLKIDSAVFDKTFQKAYLDFQLILKVPSEIFECRKEMLKELNILTP